MISALLLAVAHAQSPTPWPTSTPTPSPTPQIYSAATLKELAQLRDAAMQSDYAYRQVAHLSNNIGPRLSGSAQAAKAVEYVAGEMKALGLEVKLEKVMVPHWVRGEETAALIEFPGQAAGTTQKIVLTALGGSIATAPEGLTAEVVVVRDYDELESLGREKVSGKIVLFNHPYDAGNGGRRTFRRCLRTRGGLSRQCADRGRSPRGRGRSDPLRRERGFPPAAHGRDEVCRGRAEDSRRRRDARKTPS